MVANQSIKIISEDDMRMNLMFRKYLGKFFAIILNHIPVVVVKTMICNQNRANTLKVIFVKIGKQSVSFPIVQQRFKWWCSYWTSVWKWNGVHKLQMASLSLEIVTDEVNTIICASKWSSVLFFFVECLLLFSNCWGLWNIE